MGTKPNHDHIRAQAGPPMRLRRGTLLELLRGTCQVALVASLVDLVASLFTMMLFGEWLHHLPFRMYRDTFGPFEKLMNLEPPLMNRTMYEQPENIWRPFVSLGPTGSYIGDFEDGCFLFWNMAVEWVWSASVLLKCLVALGLCVAALQAAYWTAIIIQIHIAGGLNEWKKHAPDSLRKVQWVWFGLLPEWLLVLEQLIMARETFGRKLSAAVSAEIEAANPQAA
eukprot:TRINITY_DN31047_c0_g1_i1.p1 TRINITY_DN31047_c0_g1~~TRINITY_DN31047_c0_g1_i1.p1  ORF type:complete len:225 (-),score=36.54 TRINITY_DN31047_c0_g1_i1:113-787(-)